MEDTRDTNLLIPPPSKSQTPLKPSLQKQRWCLISNKCLLTATILCIVTVALLVVFSVWIVRKELLRRRYFPVIESQHRLNYVFTDDEELQITPNTKQCSIIDDFRFDCYPENGASQEKCEARGCCWAKADKSFFVKNAFSLGVPYCFYPENYPSYYVVNKTVTKTGIEMYLRRNGSSYYGNDVMLLKSVVDFGRKGVRQRIFDPLKSRYEVPYPLNTIENDHIDAKLDYDVKIKQNPFSMKIIHKPSRQTLVDTSFGGFIYTDKFIQLSTPIPKYIYGLGERRDNFQRSLDWQQFLMLAVDQAPISNSNLYGSQPFFLASSGPGSLVMGVLLYNSNVMEVILQPAPAATFRILGGILDVTTFVGQTAEEVIQHYTSTIGFPAMPPFWSLGFQLCRFGLKSDAETRNLWQRTRDAKIPFDVQWNDIDYMDNRRDFTYDKGNYSGLPKLVDDIHKAGMHYVVIIEPALDTPKNASSYPPYAEALKRGILVNDSTGKPFIGKVWSHSGAAWLDFTNPATTDFWTEKLLDFHKEIPIDGAWLDMNEPSNFFDGLKMGCPNSSYENPPYVPHVIGGKLAHKTICMTAKQYAGLHYNLHNLYGYSETIATNKALRTIRPGKRPFIISRSTFPGQGHYGGHWTGDVFSTWDDLHKSIAGILDFNLFGIPMVGADICGFNGNTTKKLCQRWMELGAFYPFARNHNSDDTIDQDPVSLGEEVVNASIYALSIRYSFLPYLYTLFYRAHVFGGTVARPLFFEFPNEEATYGIDTQFLWGPALIILPVLEENQFNVTVYMPRGSWYLLPNYIPIDSKGQNMTFDSPADKINVAVRGGYILPIKQPALTTEESRKLPTNLLVALDERGCASGEFYWDDGESIDAYETGIYNLINFTASDNTVKSKIMKAGAVKELTSLEKLDVLGVNEKPSQVLINGDKASFEYDDKIKVLSVYNFTLSLSNPFKITWQ